MTNLSRRSFLRGILTVTAVASVPAGIKALELPILYGDGVHDDAAGLEAFLNGKPFIAHNEGFVFARGGRLRHGSFSLSRMIKVIAGDDDISIEQCEFKAADDNLDTCMFKFETGEANVFMSNCRFDGNGNQKCILDLSKFSGPLAVSAANTIRNGRRLEDFEFERS